MPQEEYIVGQVEAIYFENPSNLYKVFRIQVDASESSIIVDDTIVCTGYFAELDYDLPYQFFGSIVNHPKFGEQFKVERYQQMEPTSKQGLIDYLSGHKFKGIGPVLATRIVDELGQDAINKIIEDSNALINVQGLSKTKQEELRNTLLQTQGTERIFITLGQWGFTAKMADKIYKAFQSKTIDLLQENPYLLVEKVEGIGFQKADQLAQTLDIKADSPDRLKAALLVVVQQYSLAEGDTYVEKETLLQETQKLLEKSRSFMVEEFLIEESLETAIEEELLMTLDNGVMLPSLYYAELGCVQLLSDLMEHTTFTPPSKKRIDEGIKAVINQVGIPYDKQQQAAIKTAMQSPVSIITGGPGTGKTTLVNGMIHLHEWLNPSKGDEQTTVLLAAPTGRAAKRLSEMTDRPATTIHRLVGYTRESRRDEFVPLELEGTLLVVDEMSMVDTWLLYWLLQSIPFGLQVIFVGDRHQLPSVGPGQVFTDLILSKTLPTIELTHIYRQEEGSSIVELAHSIQKGELPSDFLDKRDDRSFIPCTADQVPQVVERVVQFALQKGYDAQTMQVLAPMYKGPAGINRLNELLQEEMNPLKGQMREIKSFNHSFRHADKVLQLENDAELGIYNGDIGMIEGVYRGEETESKSDELVVDFDGLEITYTRSNFDQLTLAYCTSIHKSQGSEYPLVILALVNTYSKMLRRDLLYTAITRAKGSLVLLGNPQDFVTAVNNGGQERRTLLKELLQVKFETQEEVFEEEEQAIIQQQLEEPIRLTEETWDQIDPMIGMNNVTPYTI
ncbi:ATP-dependent RecD-like DNA helicase [Dolosicoccus paucivorans]|uniref:ATP-dependent RecD2 DNA helicase n=1 Tax=Dolosicoccus paucivorans TaxID=84521 RepID=A0A2N6SM64_9LACT|nr:ATP-dependent RecD-like DNA helicase [Dolosicoccus paucivorans]PMC58153.1 ATP-dependent RecD-like DNA helicase [Dolosicoccus paucivorans]